MDFIEACPECQRLSADYEAATMHWFRVQSQLRIAQFSRDDESSNRIVDELSIIGKRRQTLRDLSTRHLALTHTLRASSAQC